MTLQTRPWDVAEHLRTDEDVVGYLQACIDEAPEDAAFLAHALGDCARARGNMVQLARATGLTREGLYKSLSQAGNPAFATILKVAGAIGLQIAFVPRPAAPRKAAAKRPAKPRAAPAKKARRG